MKVGYNSLETLIRDVRSANMHNAAVAIRYTSKGKWNFLDGPESQCRKEACYKKTLRFTFTELKCQVSGSMSYRQIISDEILALKASST